ncbi:cyclase family protein [Rhodococcus opacus]|uniref:cyclase family protein n=1 Tax=Rhodococcus opacus TaxID=37919 RepID=UPI002475120C|nr:cyclase family protein [Rhodococcus opacus]MDH6291318.1 kynurenine formamidase [Rhodococcus opacus]
MADPENTQLNRRSYTREDFLDIAKSCRTWSLWGDDDELGAANYVTGSTVVRGAACVRRGAVFSLALPLDRGGPQTGLGSRVNSQHLMLRLPTDPYLEGRTERFTDDAVYLPLQAATQWDALCHMFYDGMTYNGRGSDSVNSSGAVYNSITNIKDRAVGRGVLLDLPRAKGRRWLEPGEAIQAEDLRDCAERQGVDFGEGDFLLIRTGHLARRREEGAWGDFAGGPAPGVAVSAAVLACERHVVGVASDTWGLEVMPGEVSDFVMPVHYTLLVNAGVYIGEMWDVEALALDCAIDGVYEFFLSAPPLTITGAVASPLNPLAIK